MPRAGSNRSSAGCYDLIGLAAYIFYNLFFNFSEICFAVFLENVTYLLALVFLDQLVSLDIFHAQALRQHLADHILACAHEPH